LELQQSIATAFTVKAQDEGINFSSHRAAEVTKGTPEMFFDGCPRVDPTDFQPLPSR
jgi:hypothetical protein